MSGEDGESVDPRRPNHDPDDLEPHHHSINPWWVFGFLRSFVNIFVSLGFISPRAPRRVCWFSTSVVGAAKASTKLWWVNSVKCRTFERYFSCSWTGNLAPQSESIVRSVWFLMTYSGTGKTGIASLKSGQRGPHVSFSSSGRSLLH